MAAIAVIFKSKFGYSQKYAEFIKKETGADLFNADKVSEQQIVKYKTVVICGGVYNDEWACTKVTEKLRNVLSSKFLICVMSVWNDAPEALETKELKDRYLSKVVISPDRIFALPGGIDKSKLSFGEKLTLGKVKKKIQNNESKSSLDFSILSTIDGYAGGADEKDALPVIEYIKSEGQ